jgi:hypothetical protein
MLWLSPSFEERGGIPLHALLYGCPPLTGIYEMSFVPVQQLMLKLFLAIATTQIY